MTTSSAARADADVVAAEHVSRRRDEWADERAEALIAIGDPRSPDSAERWEALRRRVPAAG